MEAFQSLCAATSGLTKAHARCKRARVLPPWTIHTALLEDRGVLRVAGEEAASFLQGLLTNDVESLAVGDARYAALLSPQGKILFDFLVLRAPVESGTAFLIDAPAAQLGDLAKRLGFYRLRAKADDIGRKRRPGRCRLLGRLAAGRPGVLSYPDPRDPRLGARAILPRAQAAALIVGRRRRIRGASHKPRCSKRRRRFRLCRHFPHDAISIAARASISKRAVMSARRSSRA